MKTETIDIIIPAHNCADTIGDTIKSLDLQLCKDFKATVVIDGADEKLEAVVETAADSRPWLRCIKSNENKGAGAARNLGIMASVSEWLMFLDADDLLLPHAIATMQQAIPERPEFVIGKTMRESERGCYEVVGREQLTWLHGRMYHYDFLTGHGITFPNDLRMSEDLAFNMKCAELAKNVPETSWPVHIQRWNGKSLSRRSGASREQARTYIKACLDYAVNCIYDGRAPEDLRLLPDALAACYYYLDVVERLFPNDHELYAEMCRDFIRLAQTVELPRLRTLPAWEARLARSLALPSRPYGTAYMPELTFEQRFINATLK